MNLVNATIYLGLTGWVLIANYLNELSRIVQGVLS